MGWTRMRQIASVCYTPRLCRTVSKAELPRAFDREEEVWEDVPLFAAVGFAAQAIDGALGMATA